MTSQLASYGRSSQSNQLHTSQYSRICSVFGLKALLCESMYISEARYIF
uniref:Uncharacterized protein n=1 Tax=Anguilla anguilla TaxID=7936 RepID=A0A0E9QTS9_ANGAN